jgi:hypothetical protein
MYTFVKRGRTLLHWQKINSAKFSFCYYTTAITEVFLEGPTGLTRVITGNYDPRRRYREGGGYGNQGSPKKVPSPNFSEIKK